MKVNMIQAIRLYSDPILTHRAVEVEEDLFDENEGKPFLEEFVLNMIETMKHHKALGLSAPQVGESVRILIIAQGESLPLIFINPSIIEHTMEIITAPEGCLSLPGITCEVPRFAELTVMYRDIEGAHQTAVLTDEEARVFQHELDHLDGKLMTTYLSPVRLGLIQGKLKRITKYRKFVEKYGGTLQPQHVHTEDRAGEIHEHSETCGCSKELVQPGQDSEVDRGLDTSSSL